MPDDADTIDMAANEAAGTNEHEPFKGEDVAPGASAIAFLEALRSGSMDPHKVIMSALAGQTEENPHLGLLLKLVEEQGEDNHDGQLREEIREEVRAEQAEAVSELSETARRLFADVEACRDRLASLAAALGACPACFGEDLLCETCGGAGAPGSRLPQADEFHRYVRPAIERVRAALRRAPPRRPWPRAAPARAADPQSGKEAGAGQ
ncbi:MAG TPA: hypothetical protein VGU70_03800 [Methylobacterium sp.]|jgi:hypothetical protein|nr:hypothetical protein [Methylobacterium sp.]